MQKQFKGNSKNKKQEGDEGVRLNKYIAHAGICSRRKADDLIKAGQVKVNGEVMLEMGHKIMPKDKVEYRGKSIKMTRNFVYILLNKPKNFITSTSDEKGRKTVMDLVQNATKERIYPVGRLDRQTTGLLLLTNDGTLAKKLSHPSHGVKKLYYVTLDKNVTQEHFDKIKNGFRLPDGKVEVDEISFVEGKGKNELGVELHIGRNRIVRRIFEHFGYQVEKLDRVMYAGLTKKNLPKGKYRTLHAKEVIGLKHFQ